MARGEVAENQRQRMQGAMVEAAAANGYGRTSVRQVVSLAGVSRRAFYEQFTNKQDCFLSTLDLVAARAAERVGQAYRSAGPDLEGRMRAALSTYAELVSSNPKSAHLVLIDAPAAGALGWGRLTRMLLKFERMLAASFAETPGATALPAGVVRGLVGGLHRIAYVRLRRQRTAEMTDLVEDMLRWTLALQSPAVEQLERKSAGASEQRAAATRFPRVAAGAGGRSASGPDGQDEERRNEQARLRILDSALEMAALEGYENLSPLRIVDHAGVSIDTFFSLFGDLEKCFMEALLRLALTVQAKVRHAGRDCEDWALTVPRALDALTAHFATHPTHGQMIATGAFEMGAAALDVDASLAEGIARQLLAGAPVSDSPIVVDAVAGAIWHTIYYHAVSRQMERLPAVADQLAYVVLAPALGAEQAAAAIVGSRVTQRGSQGTERLHRSGAPLGGHHVRV
jgi:AcrR family transcriptional regulator